MAESVMTFRIDTESKIAFEIIAKELDLTPSQMLRRYIRTIVEQHAIETAPPPPQTTKEPTPQHPQQVQTAKKPKKGQRMALAKPANWRKG